MKRLHLLWFLPALSLGFLPFGTAVEPVAHGGSAARPGGIFGYSGNPAHNGGQICTSCHSGGAQPTVTLSGPTLVQAGRTYTYELLIEGGQQDHGGLTVSATGGQFADTTGDTRVDGDLDELTHQRPKPAGSQGEVLFSFDWTAPSAAGSYTMYGAGNSVNNDDDEDGDFPDKDQLAITVDDCLVSWTQYGTGTAGSGGFVPNLDGIDGPCTGGSSLEITDGLGGARGYIWISDQAAQIPFLNGYLWIDISSLWIRIPIKLGGPKGVPGAGTLSLPAGDLSFAQGFSFYLQTIFLDGGAFKNLSLSNGLQIDIGV